MPNPSPKIYALGSCRIHTPLRRAKQHQGLNYLPNTTIEFYHNTAEIRQIAAFLAGQQELMFALSILMAMKHPLKLFNGAAEDFQYFREADAYVVEISTIKLCLYRGHQLQLKLLRDFLAGQLGIGEAQLQNLLGHSELSQTTKPSIATEQQLLAIDVLDAQLSKLYAQPELARTIKLPLVDTDQQWLAQDILETATFSLQTAEELEADLRRLHAQLGKPVLYVSHFVNLPDGTPIPQRELIREVMARVVPTLPQAAFFDPTPLTTEGGYAANLIDQGHYTEAMDLRLGKVLAEQIAKLV